ncbi:hypothetical protein GCM10027515_09370 [Schumannella luteola]
MLRPPDDTRDHPLPRSVPPREAGRMPAKHTTVDGFRAALEPDDRARFEGMRALLLELEPRLTETIKWNAPSFDLDGRDRLTFNVMNRQRELQLLLHLGASRAETRGGAPIVDDPAGLVRWLSDIRGVLGVPDAAALAERRRDYADLITRWIAVP